MSETVAPPAAVVNAPPPAAPPSASVLAPAVPAARDWIPEAYREDPAFQNFKDVNDLATSYKSASSMVGMDKGRLAVIPKDEADANGWNDVYDKLGRPKTAEEYGIKAEGNAAPMWDAATKVFHEAGLSQKQAQAMHGFVNQIEQSQKQMFADQPAQALAMVMPQVVTALASESLANNTIAKLQSEWGGAYEERMHAAKRAVAVLSNGDPDVAALFVGPEKGGMALANLPGVVKLMAAMGARIQEPTGIAGVGGGGGFQGRMSPAEGAAELSRMTADREFGKKLMAGDAEATAKWKTAQDALGGA